MSVIANDESLKDKYTVSLQNADELTITATAKGLNNDGTLKGGGVEASVSILNGTGTNDGIVSTGGATNVGSVGTYATGEIDFSQSKAEDLLVQAL